MEKQKEPNPRQEFETRLMSELEQGIISPDFIEKFRIVSEDQAGIKEFQTLMTDIYTRLFTSSGLDASVKPRIVVAESEEPNACIFTQANPPLIMVHTSTMSWLTSHDRTAGLLAHELKHLIVRNEFGHTSNSKMEEGWADANAVTMTHRAGYAPGAILEVIKGFPEHPRSIFTYLDPHPDKTTRIVIIETSLEQLKRQHTNIVSHETPFSSAEQEILHQVSQATYQGAVSKQLRAQDFYEADASAQLEMVSALIPGIIDVTEGREGYIRDIAAAISGIKPDGITTNTHHAAFNRLLDTLLTSPLASSEREQNARKETLYRAAETAWYSDEAVKNELLQAREMEQELSLPPIGKLGELFNSLREFYSFNASALALSTNELDPWPENDFPHLAAQLIPIAQRLNAVAAQFPYDLEEALTGIMLERLPEFEHFDVYKVADIFYRIETATEAKEQSASELGMLPSWDNHVRLALYSGNPALTEALCRMGANVDPRLAAFDKELEGLVYNKQKETDFTCSPDGKLIGFVSARLLPPAYINAHASIGPPDIVQSMSVAGGIQTEEPSLPSENSESSKSVVDEAFFKRFPTPLSLAEYRDRERIRLTALDEEAEILLKTIDWKDLEQDFWGFVENNKDLITPHKSIIDGGWKFADKFTEKLISLYTQDPEKYGPLIYAFMTGSDSERNWIYASFPALSNDHGMGHFIRHHEDKDKKKFLSGISSHHPYAQYVITNPHGLLSLDEQLKVGQAFITISPENPDIFAYYNDAISIDPYEALGVGKPKSVEELQSIYKASNYNSSKFAEAFERIVYDYAKDNQGTLLTDKQLYILEELAGSRLTQNLTQKEEEEELSTENLVFELHKVRNASVAGLEDTIQRLLFASNSSLMKMRLFPDLRTQYEQDIMRMGDAIVDPQQKGEMLAPLIFGINREDIIGFEKRWSLLTKEQLQASFKNPIFKNWVLNSYAAAQASVLGKDDCSSEYAASAQPIIDKIATIEDFSLRRDLLNNLAESITAQKFVSQEIYKQLKNISEKDIHSADMKSRLAEFGLYSLDDNPQAREAIIDYLTTPLSDASAQEVAQKISITRHLFNKIGISEDTRAQLGSQQQKIETDEWINFHRGFWDMPLEARMLAMENILFPPSAQLQDAAKAQEDFEKTKETILTKFLSNLAEYESLGRSIVGSYLKVNSPKAQRMLLGAIVVASEPQEGQHYKPGELLVRILVAMDAAGVKTAQALHSLEMLPAEIREDMGDCKSMSKKPTRSEIHQWLDAFGPPAAATAEEIVYVGDILGAGAYGVTVPVRKQNGQETAITLLRPNVRERAEIEFEYIVNAMALVVNEHPYILPAEDVIQQASRMSPIETDMDIAAKQAQVASTLYDGLQIMAGGETFTFRTATWIGHGHDYKETQIVQGAHFNDLPEDTPGALAHKQNIAKALLTAELYTILRGMPFDHDRHGAQQRIDGNTINQFDFGALDITLPTPTQKRLLSSTLIKALVNHKTSGISIPLALAKQRDGLDITNEDKQFLAAFERGMLALGDYTRYVGMEDLKGIFTALALNREIDTQLIRGAVSAAMETRPTFGTMVRKAPGILRNQLSKAHPGVPIDNKDRIIILQRPEKLSLALSQSHNTEIAIAPDDKQVAKTAPDNSSDTKEKSRFRQLIASPVVPAKGLSGGI